MAIDGHSTNRKRRFRRSSTTGDFDGEGVRRALLAALVTVYRNSPHFTLPQFLIALEVMEAERDGAPHTLATLVKKLDMPFSTASRIVWSLTAEGGDVGILCYIPHPTDRRKKLIGVESNNFTKQIPRVLQRAMLAYYGDSVKRLRRAADSVALA